MDAKVIEAIRVDMSKGEAAELSSALGVLHAAVSDKAGGAYDEALVTTEQFIETLDSQLEQMD